MVNLQMPLGPIQILTLGLDKPELDAKIVDEIIALEEAGTVSLLDAIMIVRAGEDDFRPAEVEDERIAGRPLLGSIVGSLIDFDAIKEEFEELEEELKDELEDEDELDEEGGFLPLPSEELLAMLDMLEEIPIGGAAAVLVLHQQWAIGLMGTIRDRGGFLIADEIAHAEETFPFGLPLADE